VVRPDKSLMIVPFRRLLSVYDVRLIGAPRGPAAPLAHPDGHRCGHRRELALERLRRTGAPALGRGL